MFENVRADIGMYRFPAGTGRLRKLFVLATTQELHAVLIFRFGRWVTFDCRFWPARVLGKILYFFLSKASQMLIGVEIWRDSRIGPGLKVEHWGCVHVMATIGRNCRISQQTTIGHIGGFKGGGCPVLGDNVYVGAGAKILGDVRIGDNVLIGANAVVIKDVPDNAVAVGVPARVLPAREGGRPAAGAGSAP